ncbi:MAG: type II toxin-antitoxin system VapC family toxin [candidate division KSB1 bacterium]|nr:type II toxin-antitoxin system VapC family toxin [candidate division KSB1 bacterium]MDZ7304672.1 type II toxin-antitoxin system VapC family toxin [candidate division KSB1 bacterium]MDZ7313796.1 type II toxin-antitoxin system VapC family toxin [candidate division KSB1 bacterium]
MKQRVYIETSIPSFYYEVRTEPEMVARREWTREWWDEHSQEYLLVISPAVLDELSRGTFPNQDKVLELVSNLQLIPVEPAITEIVQTYIKHQVMPNDPIGDALHLALASYHKCDFLLTWNCKHLANANKFHHIRRVNTMLGLFVPMLVTPLEMLGGK